MNNKCKVISISNQKGGVGKTTTTISLAVSLAKMGKKVLCVDLDPQGNLTMALGYDQPDELAETISNLLIKHINKSLTNVSKEKEEENYILHSNGIDFIPSNIELADLENILMNTMSRENVLKNFLKPLTVIYDYILIDTLPSLNILTVNALNASNEVVIPVQAQYLSAKGLELLLQTIMKVRMSLNPDLKIAGVLITMLDKRASFQKAVIDIVKSAYGEHIRIFNTNISLSVKVSETQSMGTTVFSLKDNRVANDYINFAKELTENE